MPKLIGIQFIGSTEQSHDDDDDGKCDRVDDYFNILMSDRTSLTVRLHFDMSTTPNFSQCHNGLIGHSGCIQSM